MNFLTHKGRLWATAFALFSLYVQILVPMAQGLAASKAVQAGQDLPVWVCSSQGYQQIALGDGQPVPDQPSKAIDCPVCMAHAIGMATLLPAAGAELPVLLPHSFALTGKAQSAPSHNAAPAPYHTRAPPYFA